MFEPVDERLLESRVAADLAGFAERFLRVVGAHGPEAGESLLGGYVEWLGVDLVDALVFLPPHRGRALDRLAERFLVAARRVLQADAAEHRAQVAAVARECRERFAGDGNGPARG
ncbi:MAG: hypothetical protein P1P84_10455 [Deferrisomatales bacterium]|nr:hypothetical protein [Deferrisomatales bacterium]